MAKRHATEQPKTRVFGSKEAMSYLGIDWSTFRVHVYRTGYLKPDLRIGGRMLFTQKTLDDWRDRHQTEGLTMKQAAKYLGVTFSWLRNHVYNTRLVVPDGKRGNAYIFKRDTLDAIKHLVMQA